MASLSPASPPSLASLPAEVLARCLSGGRAELLALSSTCRALRTTLDDPRAAALRPLWAAVVLAVADPAASLALADRPAPVSPDPPFLSDAEVRVARVGSMYPSFVARHHGINVVSYDEELLRGDATYLGPDASFSHRVCAAPAAAPPRWRRRLRAGRRWTPRATPRVRPRRSRPRPSPATLLEPAGGARSSGRSRPARAPRAARPRRPSRGRLSLMLTATRHHQPISTRLLRAAALGATSPVAARAACRARWCSTPPSSTLRRRLRW